MTTEDVEHLLTDDGRPTLLVGIAWVHAPRNVMPSKRNAQMLDIVTSVLRAFGDSGRRKTSDAVGDRFESGQHEPRWRRRAARRLTRDPSRPRCPRSKVMIDEVVLQGQRIRWSDPRSSSETPKIIVADIITSRSTRRRSSGPPLINQRRFAGSMDQDHADG